MSENPKQETTMIQQFKGKREKLTAAEKRERMLNAACLLKKLRSLADEVGEPLNARDEETFWNFVRLLPVEDQTSVIN